MKFLRVASPMGGDENEAWPLLHKGMHGFVNSDKFYLHCLLYRWLEQGIYNHRYYCKMQKDLKLHALHDNEN